MVVMFSNIHVLSCTTLAAEATPPIRNYFNIKTGNQATFLQPMAGFLCYFDLC